jgi:hypothetical protein
MAYRVYLDIDGDKEFLGSFPTREEAEMVAEHAADEEQEYVYVKDPDNTIVFRVNEPSEGLIYDEY